MTDAVTSSQESMPAPTKGDNSTILGRRSNTLYHAWVQLRYHRRRQRFFDMLDKETKAFTLLLGASLFGRHLSVAFEGAFPWIATGISGLSLLGLVFGYGDRKQTHKELAEQAANLIAAIEAIPPLKVDADDAARWGAELAKMLGKAPPALKVLTLICEREQSIALGKEEDAPPKIFWLRRLIADYY